MRNTVIISMMLLTIGVAVAASSSSSPPEKRRTVRKSTAPFMKSPTPPGIPNGNNGCYMNSALQFLASVPDVVNHLRTIKLDRIAQTPEEGMFLKTIKEMILGLIATDDTVPIDSCSRDLRVISQKLLGFRLGVQQDASEFIFKTFEFLEKHGNIKRFKNALKVTEIRKLSCSGGSVIPGESYVDSTIQSIFLEDEITDLSSLMNVTRIEDYGIKREECGDEQVKSNITFKTHSTIILSFNRTKFDSKTRQSSRNDNLVKYGPELMVNGIHYKLVACIFHLGNQMSSGHYTAAMLRTDKEGMSHWYYADDISVLKLKNNQPPIWEKSVTMLVYVRSAVETYLHRKRHW